MIPKSLLVGRGISFSVYADSNSLNYLYEHFNAELEAGIRIGNWRIGGKGNYSSTKSETSVYKLKDHIKFTDLSGRAKVLAVLAKQYAAGLTRPKLDVEVGEADEREAHKAIKEIWLSSPKEEIAKIVGPGFEDVFPWRDSD